MLKDRKRLWALANSYRIYLILIAVFTFLSLTAPRFMNAYNIGVILGNTMLNGIVVIGFTILLICGHLDLSTVSVINLSANLAILIVQKTDSFALGILCATLVGILVGYINGLLVTKAHINSFIETLGMSTLIQGIVSFSNNAATRAVNNFAFTDLLDKKWIPLIPNRALIVFILVAVMYVFMSHTTIGKNFYLVGGNLESAWYAGLNTNRYVRAAFSMSGGFAALGGSIYACYLAAAMANIGDKGVSPLNTLIAAAVMGGASLSGGRGNILQSYIGILTLIMLYNGMSCFKLGFEMQLCINGIVLMLIILTEAVSVYRREKYAGAKADLFLK